MVKNIILLGIAFFSIPAMAGGSSPAPKPKPKPTPHAISNINCNADSNKTWKMIDGIYFTLYNCTYTVTGSKEIKIEKIAKAVEPHSNCSLTSCAIWLADNRQNAIRFLSLPK
ncbi:hypothetical protein OAT97_00340 [Gammaproteobacteria bacterium]|nr:hypothetical protein [Gammaproteobacteria bacterium]